MKRQDGTGHDDDGEESGQLGGSVVGGLLLGQFGAASFAWSATAILCATLVIIWQTRAQHHWRGAAAPVR